MTAILDLIYREQHLTYNESIKIYEVTTSSFYPYLQTKTLVKKMTKAGVSSNPRSFDQLQTSFSDKTIVLEFGFDLKDPYGSAGYNYLQLDWTLVLETSK